MIRKFRLRIFLFCLLLLPTIYFSASFGEDAACPNIPVTTAATSWQKHVTCTEHNIEDCTKPKKENASLPLEFNHGAKTEYVVVLFHGLSDSPYFLKDIGAEAFRNGMNVIIPRLSGMGTCAEHLSRDYTKLEDWIGTDSDSENQQNDLVFSLDKAKSLGNKIIIGGFSLGGAIATYAALKYSDLPQYPMAGLLLFSPALKLPSYISAWIRFEVAVSRFLRFKAPYDGRKSYGQGVRYQKISSDSIHDLIFLTKKLEQMDHSLHIPLLTVLTPTDNRINVKSVIDFANHHGSSGQIVLFGTKANTDKYKIIVDKVALISKADVVHSHILLQNAEWSPTEANLQFNEFKTVFDNYLKSNFPIPVTKPAPIKKNIKKNN